MNNQAPQNNWVKLSVDNDKINSRIDQMHFSFVERSYPNANEIELMDGLMDTTTITVLYKEVITITIKPFR